MTFHAGNPNLRVPYLAPHDQMCWEHDPHGYVCTRTKGHTRRCVAATNEGLVLNVWEATRAAA